MTLPTFLGIGVPRAGTTWLHELLVTHPDVYMPVRRKELSFFDKYFDRGIQWYEEFFPSKAQADQYQAIGEITPHYLYCTQCPKRIANVSSVANLILIVRNPIDRAYSHYRHRVRLDNYSGSFEEFLSFRPHAIEWGFYSRYVKNYLRYFGRDQISALVYEQAVSDVSRTKRRLAGFLGVAVDRFPPVSGQERINRGYVPRFQSAYALAANADNYLRERDMDWIVNLAKKLAIKRLFGKKEGALLSMKEETRMHLINVYEDEFRELALLLDTDLECWER